MFWIGFLMGALIVGAICLAIGYGLGKKKKIEAHLSAVLAQAGQRPPLISR